MLKLTSGANATPIRVALITLDSHLASASERARAAVAREVPGLTFALHAASEFNSDPEALTRCIDDIGKADIIFVCMLFIEDHINAVLPALKARREDCDAMVVCLSAPEITKLTRMGKLRMGETTGGLMGMLKKLRGKQNTVEQKTESGAKQMRT